MNTLRRASLLTMLSVVALFAATFLLALPYRAECKGMAGSDNSRSSSGRDSNSQVRHTTPPAQSSDRQNRDGSPAYGGYTHRGQPVQPPVVVNPNPSPAPGYSRNPAPGYDPNPVTRHDRGNGNWNGSKSPAPQPRDWGTPPPQNRVSPMPPANYRGDEHRNAPSDGRIGPSRGSIRTDYSNLGEIWRRRTERLTGITHRDEGDRGRYHDHHDGDRHRHGDYNHFPWRYPHYVYEYVPVYTYPSLYCFYYGFYPPYIPSAGIVYVDVRPWNSYNYIELPLDIISPDAYGSYGGGYYLARPGTSYPGLSNALKDIRQAWEDNDVSLLSAHMEPDSNIAVFLSGEYSYSLNSKDYYDMTMDAMTSLSTASFEFYRIQRRDDDEVVAYGRHTYFDDFDNAGNYSSTDLRKTVYVSYTLRRYDGDWYITEVGSSPVKM